MRALLKSALRLPEPTQFDARQRARLRARLLEWYGAHQRDLPWRRTRDPYRIWVSEVMLQQTRVAAVVEKYERFLERFPDIQALARAEVADVLTVWSGLGYYRRARALHAAARRIVNAGGSMPGREAEWRELPGIGRYTAAAIASIAHGECCAVVDGNVERVVRRLTADARGPMERVWATAQAWLSRSAPGDSNQALMELGATVCLPGVPRCPECPLFSWCKTRGTQPAGAAQARQKKRSAYALSVKDGAVYLKQRGNGERLMPGMWELPEIARNGAKPMFTVQHSITVTDFRVSVFRSLRRQRGGRWVAVEQVETLPLTGLARKILRRAGII